MNLFEKLYTVIIFLSVAIGIAIGQIDGIQENAEAFILPLLMLMLYLTFMQIPIHEIGKAFKNIKFTSISVIINFIWTPVLAWLLALLFLRDSPALFIGFIMLMVTPCTDWYLIFTKIARGNVALSMSILPLNLLLQIVLLPLYLLVFAGTAGVIELEFLIKSILLVLIVPLILALFTNWVFKKHPKKKESVLASLSALPLVFLSLAILAMFASQGNLLLANLDLLWKLLLPILLFFLINYVVSQETGERLNFPKPEKTSLGLTTIARNSPVALAIAITAFPNQPLIALTLIIGPLLELPILALVSQVLLVTNREDK
ncbi:arsenic resistance protein [Jeotgalibacillus proteolyticus]|uniref:Arsenic resistance protein n=1 Tax=Jeotgalibacillus proteolyticus TaxID=2082395 RepID=A0A2S5GFU4_9BACL|nr:bile acid:sodium symporter [Jeotgalibacillus proteolyticus]PPA71795.1 arsenic resistance protein [Jeotgalibacillus proteolyticus]